MPIINKMKQENKIGLRDDYGQKLMKKNRISKM